MDLKLPIRDGNGRVYQAETPDDLDLNEFLREFVPGIGKPLVDERGIAIRWVLVDSRTGRALDSSKTFRENGVPSSRELLLTSEFIPPTPPPPPPTPPVLHIELTVQDPKDRILRKRVLPETSVRQFLHDALVEFGLPTDAKWAVNDRDISRILSLHETLSQNGVSDGHHLFLREVPDEGFAIPWKQIGIAAAVVAAVMLCGLGGYRLYRWLVDRRPAPPVTVVISPSGDVNLGEGKTQRFSAQVTGNSNTRVTWSIDPPGLGTITQDGTYTPPPSISEAQTVTIIAQSVAEPNRDARAQVHLIAHIILSDGTSTSVHIVHPDTLRVPQGGHHQFSADNMAVTWSIDPPDAGSITPQGLYAAPGLVTQPRNVTVIATSEAGQNTSDRFIFSVIPAIHLSISPETASLQSNQSQQFSISGLPSSSHSQIEWLLSPSVGQLSQSGLYTAPDFVHRQQIVTITARMRANPHNQASAVLTLVHTECHGRIRRVENGVVDLHPLQTYQFRVAGADDESSVEWSVYPVGAGEVHRGLYTAPGTIPPDGQKVYVKARCGNTEEMEMIVNLLP